MNTAPFKNYPQLNKLYVRISSDGLCSVGNCKFGKEAIQLVLTTERVFESERIDHIRPKYLPSNGVRFFFGGQTFQGKTLNAKALLDMIALHQDRFQSIMPNLETLAHAMLEHWETTTLKQQQPLAA